MTIRILAAVSLPLLLLAGCGGGSSSSGPSNGSVSLSLGADSTLDWSQIVMGVEEIDASTDGSHWSAVATPRRTFDLLKLEGGSPITLASQAQLAPGTYRFRIVWATTNYDNGVFLPAYAYPAGSATGIPLTMPSSTILPGSVSVGAGQAVNLLAMLDSASSVQSFQGASTQVFFQPSPGLFDTTCCTFSGSLVDGGGQPLSGAEVFAEIIDGTGTPHLMRRALTRADGTFLLDGLPASLSGVQASYYFVAMPVAGSGSSYPAVAAGPVLATPGGQISAPQMVAAASSLTTGELDASFTPETPSGQGTFADLRQSVNVGSSSPFLIVRANAVGTVVSTGDSYAFRDLPPGSYGVNALRFTPNGSATGSATSPSLVVVNAGATSSVNLTIK